MPCGKGTFPRLKDPTPCLGPLSRRPRAFLELPQRTRVDILLTDLQHSVLYLHRLKGGSLWSLILVILLCLFIKFKNKVFFDFINLFIYILIHLQPLMLTAHGRLVNSELSLLQFKDVLKTLHPPSPAFKTHQLFGRNWESCFFFFFRHT